MGLPSWRGLVGEGPAGCTSGLGFAVGGSGTRANSEGHRIAPRVVSSEVPWLQEGAEGKGRGQGGKGEEKPCQMVASSAPHRVVRRPHALLWRHPSDVRVSLLPDSQYLGSGSQKRLPAAGRRLWLLAYPVQVTETCPRRDQLGASVGPARSQQAGRGACG